MFHNFLLEKLFGKVVERVQKKNHDNPDIKTADASVFDNLLKKNRTNTETKEEVVGTQKSRADLYRDFYEKIKQTKEENEADPNVETADPSVFDEMQREIERLKAKIEEKEAKGETDFENWDYTDDDDFSDYERHQTEPTFEQPTFEQPTFEQPSYEQPSYERPTGVPSNANMAVTNSFGGSIALRMNPDMGAPQNVIRVPDQSMIKVLEYSDKKIILDNKETRWVKIDYNGNQGWILESYMNF
ncbi:MAG: hypothetical protein AAGK97_04445 [Bacteroidota bacterium]